MKTVEVYQLDDHKNPYDKITKDDYYLAERIPASELVGDIDEVLDFFMRKSRGAMWQKRGMRPIRTGDKILFNEDKLYALITDDVRDNKIPGWNFNFKLISTRIISVVQPLEYIDVNFHI